jgi:SAM-dependent methyltransferase
VTADRPAGGATPASPDGPGGGWDGERYQRRFDVLAASGVHVHGEADFVSGLGPSSVLDAGCGSGRVGIELARRGVAVVGVDADPSMVAAAARRAPELTWVTSDLAGLDLGRRFDVVVMAGNVPLFTPAGTRRALVAGCARHLAPGGRLVAGFQLGRGYGPDDYDADAAAAGLEPDGRWSTWERAPYPGDGSYLVAVDRAPG